MSKLNQIWTDIAHWGSFRGPQVLAKAAKVSLAEAKQFLEGKHAYTLTKTTKNRFQRKKYLALQPFQNMSFDLADVSRLGHSNKGFKWIMVATIYFQSSL